MPRSTCLKTEPFGVGMQALSINKLDVLEKLIKAKKTPLRDQRCFFIENINLIEVPNLKAISMD